MNVLVISGSTRRDGLNTRLAHLLALSLPDDRVVVRQDLAVLPFFDADVEAAGTPPEVAGLTAAVRNADLLVLSTPEYNGTVPGVLANAIDWLSRPHRTSPLNDREVIVMSASPGAGGGRRAAAHLREVLARTGARVHPDGLAVPRAHERLAGSADLELHTELHAMVHGTRTDPPVLTAVAVLR